MVQLGAGTCLEVKRFQGPCDTKKLTKEIDRSDMRGDSSLATADMSAHWMPRPRHVPFGEHVGKRTAAAVAVAPTSTPISRRLRCSLSSWSHSRSFWVVSP
jgi:hypothetical protein